jgi:hypothetical protein
VLTGRTEVPTALSEPPIARSGVPSAQSGDPTVVPEVLHIAQDEVISRSGQPLAEAPSRFG